MGEGTSLGAGTFPKACDLERNRPSSARLDRRWSHHRVSSKAGVVAPARAELCHSHAALGPDPDNLWICYQHWTQDYS